MPTQETDDLWLSIAPVDHAGGTILDFELTSANADERDAARDLLLDKRDLTVIGEEGFISEPLASELATEANIRLMTLRRRNQHEREGPKARRIINQVRQIIETVNGQLTEQFGIETNHAHSFWGDVRACIQS